MCFRIHHPDLSTLFVFFSFMLLAGCKTPYIADQFDALTTGHRDVAILPFHVLNTGVVPQKLSEQEVLELELAEGEAFQISFYNEVLGSTRRGRRNLRVNLQSPQRTNRLLRLKGWGGSEVEDHSFEEVARVLGVDAVLVGQIQKNRLMSDLASYGIELGVHILDVLSPHPVWPFLPGEATLSKQIKASYAIYEGENGRTLWSVSYDHEADWRRRANDIIDETNRRAARQFPYRSR